MNVKVYFRLSQAGQKAALLAGKPAAKEQVIEGEIAESDLDMCRIMPDGVVIAALYKIYASLTTPLGLSAYCDGRYFKGIGSELFTVPVDLEFDAPPESASQALSTIRVEVEAARQKALQKALAAKQAKLDEEVRDKERADKKQAAIDASIARLEAELAADPDAVPDLQNWPDCWAYEWYRESQHPAAVERRRRIKASEARERQVAAAQSVAKTVAIRSWLIENATANHVERFDAGLLAESEYKQLMADAVFAPISVSIYQFLTDADVRDTVEDDDGRYDECEAQFRSVAPDSLTAEQWESIKSLRASHPNITFEPRLHQGTLDSNDVAWGVVERYGVLATATVAGVEVKREYAL